MNREEGYYWIQFEDEPWEIAFFKNGRWSLCGTDDSFHDKDFYKIDENKLKKGR